MRARGFGRPIGTWRGVQRSRPWSGLTKIRMGVIGNCMQAALPRPPTGRRWPTPATPAGLPLLDHDPSAMLGARPGRRRSSVRILNIEHVEAGMVLARPVYDGAGTILLGAGVELTSGYLGRLTELGYSQ